MTWTDYGCKPSMETISKEGAASNLCEIYNEKQQLRKAIIFAKYLYFFPNFLGNLLLPDKQFVSDSLNCNMQQIVPLFSIILIIIYSIDWRIISSLRSLFVSW